MIRTLAGVAAATVLVTACSGIPSSSKPQVIGRGSSSSAAPAPTGGPQPNAEPRAIVQEFLQANVSEPLDQRAAREYLMPEQQRRWSDQTVTILKGGAQDVRVGIAAPGSPPRAVAVEVSGIQLGSLAADGTYTPAPVGSGGAGQPWSYQFGLDPLNGQSRISDAPDGLIVSAADFAQVYRPTKLYFLDSGNGQLVPDVRYTALQSPQAVAQWQLTQLLAGPRAQLANAVHTELPSLPSTARPSVTMNGSTLQVELPGSSHLDPDAASRLSKQLVATFGGSVTITDGGTAVDVSTPPPPTDVGKAPQPSPGDLGSKASTTTQSVYYLDGSGRLVTQDGQPVRGPLGVEGSDLSSVAVAQDLSGPDLYVAACSGSGNSQRLLLGTDKGLQEIGFPSGPLTRPDWTPGRSASLAEVWVANGPDVYRIHRSDNTWTIVPTTLSGGRIVSLRISPEGSRIAMIVQGAGGASQLWAGSIVRTGTGPNDSVRIDSVQPITSAGYRLTDVAWSDNITLWVIGSDGQRRAIWSVNVDGANFRERSSAGLPQLQVDSIAAAPSVVQWVSVGGYVFSRRGTDQQGADWEGPGRHTTRGRSPVYVVYLN